MVAAKFGKTTVVVEYLRILFEVLPRYLVDVVGRLIAVVHSLLVAEHLLAGKYEWHTLRSEYCCLCEKVETYELVLGDTGDARFQTVNETHVVVAAHVGYHLCR